MSAGAAVSYALVVFAILAGGLSILATWWERRSERRAILRGRGLAAALARLSATEPGRFQLVAGRGAEAAEPISALLKHLEIALGPFEDVEWEEPERVSFSLPRPDRDEREAELLRRGLARVPIAAYVADRRVRSDVASVARRASLKMGSSNGGAATAAGP